jgi:hypothetical protein
MPTKTKKFKPVMKSISETREAWATHQLTAFEHGLRSALEADPKLSRRGKRILAVLDARPSKARTRRIERMERHARAQLGDKAPGDWSDFPWGKFVSALLNILLALLPFLL